MSNGKGCKCHAHCEHECCCDADWTTKEVYDLRADLAQRTAERDATNAHFLDAWRERADFARELERELALRTAERNALAADLAALKAERDEAVDALKRIATYDYRGNQSGESQIARHALIAMRKGDGDGK
jgi:hypothetical protein